MSIIVLDVGSVAALAIWLVFIIFGIVFCVVHRNG